MRRFASRQTCVDVSEQPAASIHRRISRETSVSSQTTRRHILGQVSVVTAMNTWNLMLLQNQFRIHSTNTSYLATKYRNLIRCHR